MLPATLAILSTTFQGKERAMAFGAWGAVAGSAAGLGPVLGGWLTSDYSWRWSFRINVIIAPIAIVGALIAFPRAKRGAREPLDLPGASLIAGGMFLLVFALSEGGTYGWFTPTAAFTMAGHEVWASSAPLAVTPIALLLAMVLLGAFYRVERRREAEDRRPMFEFGLLRHRTFRYGLTTTVVLAMGQLGLGYALALFLQQGKHLSALHNGLWVLPMGLSILLTAPLGGRLAQRVGTVRVIRIGLVIQASGLLWIALVVGEGLTFWSLMPGLVGYGMGVGWASAQLTNVVLSEVPAEKAGVASGTNTTVRQVGSALGIAVIGTLVTTQTIRHAVAAIGASTTLPAGVKATAIERIRHASSGYQVPSGGSSIADELRRTMTRSVGFGTRDALLFAGSVVLVGLVVSFLLPADVPAPDHEGDLAEELADDLAPLVPIDPEAELLDPTTA